MRAPEAGRSFCSRPEDADGFPLGMGLGGTDCLGSIMRSSFVMIS